jgi:HEAT repeat protein
VIAREAAQRAGALRLTSAVPPLGAALRGAPELRTTAAQALAEIGSTGALQLLAGVLEDPEREVRLVALRAIAAQGYRAALPLLEALIRDRRVRAADLTEQMVTFEAFGALCGDEHVGVLDQLLNGRSLLGRKQEPALRACAAVALGRVQSAAARQALGRAADEKDVVVRTAVQRAIRGAS